MDYEFRKFPFLTISLFAGLFTGFILTIANLVYDFIYRAVTEYDYSQIINVSSIIFLSVLLLTIAGFIYFLLVKFISRGDLIYSALFIIATALLTIIIVSHQYGGPYALGFKWLAAGTTLITGTFASFGVPYFAKHYNAFL